MAVAVEGSWTHDGPVPDDIHAKAALRSQLRAARAARPAADRAAAAERLAQVVLSLPEVATLAGRARPGAGDCVAAYVSVGSEPPTQALLAGLVDAGLTVLLPVLLPDLDLDWAVYDPGMGLVPSTVPGRSGLREPPGARLGTAAVAGARLVLVPALAASKRGDRLGQGGGSYDRALARVRAGAATAAVLFDGELRDQLPAEPHDRRVAMAVTPSGVVRF